MADYRARRLFGLIVAGSLVLALSACDTVASLDPTGLLGDDDNGATPDLASVPSAPGGATTPDDQSQVAGSLNADGAKAQYSADALRAGTEASAPPPDASGSTVGQTAIASAAPPSAEPAAPPPSAEPPSAAPSAAPPSANDDAPPSADTAPSAAPQAAPVASAPMPSAPMVSSPTPPEPVRTASAVPAVSSTGGAMTAASGPAFASPVGASSSGSSAPSGAEPAVPPGAPGRGIVYAPVMSDAALGFKPSAAPPLDPSINKWVSPPILAHYRQTASLSGMGGGANAAVPTAGGAASLGGVEPTATVLFAGDGIAIGAAGRAQIRTAVTAFKAEGGSGTIRVVGHASSRTANMPVEKHLELIFDKSQKRANAVAQELIHQGVPANQVMVEAVGDSQPVYYESMPKGEDGNRRAEIFVQ